MKTSQSGVFWYDLRRSASWLISLFSNFKNSDGFWMVQITEMNIVYSRCYIALNEQEPLTSKNLRLPKILAYMYWIDSPISETGNLENAYLCKNLDRAQ